MNCSCCKRPLKIVKITYDTLVVFQDVIGVSSLGDLQCRESQTMESEEQRMIFFKCAACFDDIELTEQQVIDIIKNNPDYAKRKPL